MVHVVNRCRLFVGVELQEAERSDLQAVLTVRNRLYLSEAGLLRAGSVRRFQERPGGSGGIRLEILIRFYILNPIQNLKQNPQKVTGSFLRKNSFITLDLVQAQRVQKKNRLVSASNMKN